MVFYRSALERIGLGCFARGLFQSLQGIYALQHFLYGVRAEQVEVNTVELVRVFALVSSWPFLRVAYCSNAFEICARNEV